MLIPAASHNGASAVLTALLISDLKRRGRSAAPCPHMDAAWHCFPYESSGFVFPSLEFEGLGLAVALSREAFGSSQRGEVHHGTL